MVPRHVPVFKSRKDFILVNVCILSYSVSQLMKDKSREIFLHVDLPIILLKNITLDMKNGTLTKCLLQNVYFYLDFMIR